MKYNYLECAPTNTSNGVKTFGNMAVLGSKKFQKCRFGFLPREGDKYSKELLCTKDGWQTELECVPRKYLICL